MKLFHVERTDGSDYDEFEDFVVAAESADDARLVNPVNQRRTRPPIHWNGTAWADKHGKSTSSAWPINPTTLRVTRIVPEKLTAGTIVCSSFNAG